MKGFEWSAHIRAMRLCCLRSRFLVSLCVVFVASFALTQGQTPLMEYPEVGLNVFDPQADGMAQLDAALLRARQERKRVLIFMGANWCPWCHRLGVVFDSDPALMPYFQRDLIWVKIDINPKRATFPNRAVLERFGMGKRFPMPAVLVLESDGTVIARPSTEDWELPGQKTYDRQKILAAFAEWTRS